MDNTLKDKALQVIEWMAVSDIINGEESIYKFSHIANSRCVNPHEDWIVELNQLYDKLKSEGQI